MTNVFFATNRRPYPLQTPRRFSGEFSPHGTANLRFGEAEVQGSQIRLRVAPEDIDYNARQAPSDAPQLGSTPVFAAARERLQADQRDLLLFIHGYNVDFREALSATARLSEELAAVGGGQGLLPALFSWPSDGSMKPWLAYASDRRDAAASGPALGRALLKMVDYVRQLSAEEHCGRRVHLMAHSMGNYVLRHALQEVLRQSAGRPPRLFDQIFLMAPDEDDDAFEHDHKLRQLPRLARHVQVYFNREDRAMAISDTTKGNPDRLGDDGPRLPFQVPAKVTQVDCTRVVSGIVEHSYYLECPEVVRDLVQVLDGVAPQDVGNRRFLDDRNRYELTP